MPKVLEKVERRYAEHLFIKGERCLGPKCALNRKPYPPGAHGNKKSKGKGRGRGGSEFGLQLAEKQKVRYMYGLSEKNIRGYFKKALAIKTGTTADNFLNFVERRLDNAVYRSGLAVSRSVARHLVSHGHVLVNGKGISAPSYLVHTGDVIGIKETRIGMPAFTDLVERLKKGQTPAWLEINQATKEAKVVAMPIDAGVSSEASLKLVVEFYSR